MASPSGDLETPPPDHDADAPRLTQASVLARLARLGRGDASDADGRYQVERMLGIGGGGRVYAVTDTNLRRSVALKVLADAGEDGARQLLEEARITASLSHPNVLPVYELDLTDDGRIYFTMKRIDGRPLSSLIEQSPAGGPVAAASELVRIFIGIAQALAYAHHQGVVHQDLKPDNVMLGAFGEVLVVDWGSATRLDEAAAGRVYGTPLYMSPEQARAERSDRRSDIYCLGSSLFHALTARLPLWRDDPDEFWTRKRRGELDPPTAAERRRVPAALLDIALKAMRAEPAERYQSADEMLQDLGNYQAGLAVSAHAEGWLERARRWHRRYARRIWPATVAAALVLTLAALLYGERLKDLARWGQPVIAQDFVDDGWQRDWTVTAGSFARKDGALVSSVASGAEAVVMCRRRLYGAIAVEYDAEFAPGEPPGDLSLVWCQDPAHGAAATGYDDPQRYLLQVGAFDASCSMIGSSQGCVAFSYVAPVAGHRYHIRDEIDGDRLSIAVDGQTICEYRLPMPVAGGYVGLRAFYRGKAFSRVRIYERDVPERLPATALGDLLVQQQRLPEAAEQYRRVVDAHPGTALAREALYRQGLCALWQRRFDEADTTWRPLAGGGYEPLLSLHRLERWFDARDHERLLAGIEAACRDASADIRHRAALQWCRYANALGDDEPVWADRYIALHQRLFADDSLTDRTAAQLLLRLGRYRAVLSAYPRLRFEDVNALFHLGRFDLALRDFPDQVAMRDVCLFNTGRATELAEDSPLYLLALPKRGLAEEALRRADIDVGMRGTCLLALGRLEETTAKEFPDWARGRALIMLGRFDEVPPDLQARFELAMARGDGEAALALARPGSLERRWARTCLGLQAWMRGDRAAAERWFELEPQPENYGQWDYREFLIPFLHGLGGDRAELERSCRQVIDEFRYFHDQHDWFFASYLMGRIGEQEVLDQPYRQYAEADLLRAKGMRAEHEGRVADALAAYRGYLALPVWRRGERVDPVWDGFVRWRVQELERK